MKQLSVSSAVREKRVVLVASLTHFIIHINMVIFPVIVLPFSRETGLPISEVFPLSFLMYLLYGMLALPAGYAADRWSKALMLKICMLGTGLSAIGVAFSTGTRDFGFFLALVGLFCGLYHPVGMGLIAREIQAQGKAHGVNGIFGALGEATGPLVAGITLFFLDWRWVYVITGMMGVVGFAVAFFLPVTEREHHEIEAERGRDTHKREYLGYFAILVVAMTMGGLIYRANLTAMPAYLEMRAGAMIEILKGFAGSGLNAGSGAAGILASTLFVFTIAGQYVGGWMADRYDLRRVYLTVNFAALPFVLGMAFLHGPWLYLSAGFFLFFTLGMQPVENSLVTKFIPRRWFSTGYGIKFTFTFGVGSLAVYEVAYVEKWGGLPWLYPLLSAQVAMLVVVSAVLLLVSIGKIARVANLEKPSTEGGGGSAEKPWGTLMKP
jgi:MFS family permease